MIEWMIIGLVLISCYVAHNWHKVFWNGEDWKHLRLRDDWDAAKSRGRIRERRV